MFSSGIRLRPLAMSSAILLLAQTASAQPAVFQDGVLTIPSGVVITEEGHEYYTNVQLQDDGQGNFTVIEAHEGNLAHVEQVEIMASDEAAGHVDVLISGYKSTPCVDLQEPLVAHGNYRVNIVVAETEPFAEVCILRLDAFETIVSLDTDGWPGGTWLVSANGVQAEFEVP